LAILAIVNPAAGNGRCARVWERLRQDVDGLAGWDFIYTERAGHARELAESAARAGVERVVAVGGDGTVCEVANGLAHSETALGTIPIGTGNDTARNLRIPRQPSAAAKLMTAGATRAIDLGVIRTAQATSYFVNVAGFGFDAEVAWQVNRLPKLVGGTLPYVVGVVQTLWGYHSPRMRLSVDGHVIERRVFLVAVANSASYGGGMLIAPDASPEDGLFDVCVVSDLSRFEVLRLVPKLYSGGHIGHSAVEMMRCRELSADADRRVRCQADGELVGDLPATFELRPAALQCVTGPAPR
jgi:diacylglycerol kinase (ATP)